MSDAVRLDKWLWAARFFKTRSQATDACQAGHVKLDGEPLKPARDLRLGETLEVRTAGGRKIVRVLGAASVRGPATVARALYEDLTPPEPPRPSVVRDAGAGRPTKRDRREIARVFGE